MYTGNSLQRQRQTLSQSKRVGKNSQANNPKKQDGVAILIGNKVDFQQKVIKKDKEGHFLLITEKICKEELSIFTYMLQIQEHPYS